MFENRKKLIVTVSNAQLLAGLWQGSKLQSYRVFANNDDEHTAFSQYLSQHADLNIYLIVDAVEEDYKLENLPHTSGAAKRELLERKLSQFNRSSQYRTAHFINRSSDKRKDDNYLFVALTKTEFLQPWMDAIQANHASIVGVYLLPMISQVMVRQMKLMAPNILLCEQLSSGLRQTFLHNGRLRLSRLAPMVDVKPNQLAYFYVTEIEKTRLYLQSQRLLLGETALQIVLPAKEEHDEEVAKSISLDQESECKTVPILAFAKNINLSAEAVVAHPELMHMQLLANGNLPDNLAPKEVTKNYNLNSICRTINVASIAVTLLGAMFAGYQFYQGYQQKNQINQVAAQTQQQQAQYQSVAQNFPTTPIPSQDLKVAAELAKTIKHNAQSPRELMEIISAAAEEGPEISLNRMRWVLSEQIDIKDDDGTQVTSSNNNTSTTQVQNDPTKLLQIGFLNAEIRGFTGDYRAALDSVSRFTTKLRANPKVAQVLILQEPVNVSSLANLQGSTTDEGNTERAPAIFKIKIILKPTEAAQ